MSEITVRFDGPSADEFNAALIEQCARRLLQSYVYDEDGEECGVPSELARRINDQVVATIREEASRVAPETARAALDGTPSLPAGGGEGLRATLEWYADENNYDPEGAPGEAIGGGRDFDTGAYEIDDWEQDFGRRAREALAAGPARINASSAGAILTTETISRSPQPGCAARRLDDDAIRAAWERVSPRVPATVEMLRSFLSSLSSPLPGAGDGVAREVRGHRFEVECRDCEQLDTYGKHDSYVELGREHVRETGHRVFVKATTFMDLVPPAPADDKEMTR